MTLSTMKIADPAPTPASAPAASAAAAAPTAPAPGPAGASVRREVLLEGKPQPPGPRKVSRMPVWRTIGFTLDISARFLLRTLVGKGTITACDRLLDSYWRRIIAAGDGAMVVEGREHFEGVTSSVVMTNHASLVDIPAIMAAVPGSRVRMVFKEELSRIPVWGQALVASGFVPIDRKNRQKAIAQLEKAKAVLKQGVHVWVSPEGTRSRDGKLGAFKKGGFHTALALGVPIIPGWIDGARDILPPDQFSTYYNGCVTVRFGAPVSTEGLTSDDLPALMDEVRRRIVALSGQPDPLVGTAPPIAVRHAA
jgi:1-acyl-sn-glycerol-3-phosphate acyltransferase